MDESKLQLIQEWQIPRSVKDVLSFLGFVTVYRMFNARFGLVALPLTELTKGKNKVFVWTDKSQEDFVKLKLAFTTAADLKHYEANADSWVEVDASNVVVAGVLSQFDDNGRVRPEPIFQRNWVLRSVITRYTVRSC